MEKLDIKKRLMIKRLVKVICQVGGFLLLPGLFSLSFMMVERLIGIASGNSFEASDITEAVVILAATVPSTVLFGRYFCGYFCSFGAMQDLMHFVFKKVRSLLKKKSDKQNEYVPEGEEGSSRQCVRATVDEAKNGKKNFQKIKFLGLIKYVVLLVIVVVIVFDIKLSRSLSPWTAFGFVSDVRSLCNASGLLSVGGGLLLLIVIGSLFSHRVFCRYICPMGAIYSLLSRFHIVKNRKHCKNGGDCSMCGYKCDRGSNSFVGIIFTLVVLVAANLYLQNVVYAQEDMTVVENYANEAVSRGEADADIHDGNGQSDGGTGSVAGVQSSQTDDVSCGQTDSATGGQTGGQNGVGADKDISEYRDGVYSASAKGYKGRITVAVTVEKGVIAGIEITDFEDDKTYVKKVSSKLILRILKNQSIDVDAVSGATYTSSAVLEATGIALEASKGGASGAPEQSVIDYEAQQDLERDLYVSAGAFADRVKDLPDGVYEGTGEGFKGDLGLKVTVEGGEVTAIDLESYYDTKEYLFYVAPYVLDGIVQEQSLNIDAVSGATYSRNGLVRAVANALGIPEDEYELAEARPRPDKDKPGHHLTQKFIETHEEYEELVEQYKNIVLSPDGKNTYKKN